jgi:hypothetical protein
VGFLARFSFEEAGNPHLRHHMADIFARTRESGDDGPAGLGMNVGFRVLSGSHEDPRRSMGQRPGGASSRPGAGESADGIAKPARSAKGCPGAHVRPPSFLSSTRPCGGALAPSSGPTLQGLPLSWAFLTPFPAVMPRNLIPLARSASKQNGVSSIRVAEADASGHVILSQVVGGGLTSSSI